MFNKDNVTSECSRATLDPDSQSSGFLQYQQFIYCFFNPSFQWSGLLLLACLLIYFFAALSIVADRYFCPNLFVFAGNLKLSHNIAGVTFLAFGNGAPDIFSSIASVVGQETFSPGFALGGLLGAGIFLSTVVAGIVVAIKPFQIMQRPFLRDVIFYLAALYWIFYMLYKRRIRLIDSVGLLILYVVYVLTVGIGRLIRKRYLNEPGPVTADDLDGLNESDILPYQYDLLVDHQDAHNSSTAARELPICRDESPDDDVEVYLVNNQRNSGFLTTLWISIRPFSIKQWRTLSLSRKICLSLEAPLLFLCNLTIPVIHLNETLKWRKSLVLAQCIVCPLFALIVVKKLDYLIYGFLPLVVTFLCTGAFCTLLIALFTKYDEPPKCYTVVSYFGFLMAILWIFALAQEVISLLTVFGSVLNISQEILGLTVLAWSNSLGDLISDTTVAMKGYPKMALSACFGGPLFNVLVGMGVSFTILCAKHNGEVEIIVTPVAEVLCLTLAVSLISSFLILPASKFKATRFYAAYLIAFYFVFIVVIVLTELNFLPAIWNTGS